MDKEKLELISLWDCFKTKLLETLADAKPFEVDLSFEYKDASGFIQTFSSGDPIYINAIKVSASGTICFEVPSGASSKYIPLCYADSISSEDLGNLNEFVEKLYKEAIDFVKPKKKPELAAFVSYLLDKGDNKIKVANILNTSADYISKTIQFERDKKSFQALDDFGMF